jgi:hypothetical protein
MIRDYPSDSRWTLTWVAITLSVFILLQTRKSRTMGSLYLESNHHRMRFVKVNLDDLPSSCYSQFLSLVKKMHSVDPI